MNDVRSLGLGRAISLSLAYAASGAFVLAFSLAGKRPWTGFTLFLLLTWAFQVHVSRRPWGELGLPLSVRGLGEWVGGAVLGLSLFSLVTLGLWATGAVRFRAGKPDGSYAVILIALAVFALVEEMFFRGFPLLNLSRALGPVRALVVTSFLFGLAHLANPASGIQPFLGVFFAGGVMGAAYLRWRSLWAAWGLHFAWNAAQGVLYGFPVSGITQNDLPIPSLLNAVAHGPSWWTGGAFGPEGSLLTFLVLGAAAWLLVCLPRSPSLEELGSRREGQIRMSPRDETFPDISSSAHTPSTDGDALT